MAPTLLLVALIVAAVLVLAYVRKFVLDKKMLSSEHFENASVTEIETIAMPRSGLPTGVRKMVPADVNAIALANQLYGNSEISTVGL